MSDMILTWAIDLVGDPMYAPETRGRMQALLDRLIAAEKVAEVAYAFVNCADNAQGNFNSVDDAVTAWLTVKEKERG